MSLFPATRHSVLDELKASDPARRRAARETLAAAYLRPVQTYIGLRWGRSSEEARDLAQEFFRSVVERELLEKYDALRARLRTYLRLCVDALVRNASVAGRSERRGGGTVAVPLEAVQDHAVADTDRNADALFEREWRRSIFSLAVERTRTQLLSAGKGEHWAVLEGFDLAGLDDARPSYAQLAGRLGLAVTDVTNRLSYARRVLRQRTLEVLRELTLDDADFRAEARTLLGVDVP